MDDRYIAIGFGTMFLYFAMTLIAFSVWLALSYILVFLIALPAILVIGSAIAWILRDMVGTIIHNDVLWNNEEWGVKEKKYFGIW